MQQSIVEAALAGENLLGILPTGAGKSLCYQIPALSRYDKTGALTVVISPLVALMADQVAGLEARGVDSCVTINGLLSMPERSDALDRVRARGCRNPHHIARAASQRQRTPSLESTGNRRVGARRGPLSLEVGGTPSVPTIGTLGASYARGQGKSRFRRCCA